MKESFKKITEHSTERLKIPERSRDRLEKSNNMFDKFQKETIKRRGRVNRQRYNG